MQKHIHVYNKMNCLGKSLKLHHISKHQVESLVNKNLHFKYPCIKSKCARHKSCSWVKTTTLILGSSSLQNNWQRRELQCYLGRSTLTSKGKLEYFLLPNGGKKEDVWNTREPLWCLSVLSRHIIKVNGKLQKINSGRTRNGSDIWGMKVWVTPTIKEAWPTEVLSEGKGNTEWTGEEGVVNTMYYHVKSNKTKDCNCYEYCLLILLWMCIYIFILPIYLCLLSLVLWLYNDITDFYIIIFKYC